jgi:DNA topoisomerase-1
VPRKKHVIECIKRVAERLGNTPAVCRKCYVHPTVFDAYFEGRLASAFERAQSAEGARTVGEPQALALSSVETAVLRLLQTKTDPAAALAASVAALETRHHAA